MKRMVNENLIAILKEMDNKGISVSDLADMLEAFTDEELQPTLTAGDNIQISEENVISATDTTYTAGDGIDITDGVISSTNSLALYESRVNMTKSGQTISVHIYTKEEITSANVSSIMTQELANTGLHCYSSDGVVDYGDGNAGIPIVISIVNSTVRIQIVKSDFTKVGYNGGSLNTFSLSIAYSRSLI